MGWFDCIACLVDLLCNQSHGISIVNDTQSRRTPCVIIRFLTYNRFMCMPILDELYMCLGVCFTMWAYPNGPEAGREAGWGSEFVPLKKREVGSFILLHKISRTACCFGIRTFLKQYDCYESATIWYTDHQYLAQYSEIINNLQEIPLIFCNYAVRSCGTWRKGPGQSPCNVLLISDLELYVTETSMGVSDPVTD